MDGNSATETVTALIVNYRTPTLAARAAEAARAAGVGAVVIVDNGSGDESVVVLERLHGVQVVLRQENGGFGVAANVAATHAQTDALMFLNSDAELTPGALPELVRALDGVGARAMVGPRLVQADGTIQRSAGMVPKPADLALRALGGHHLARWLNRVPLLSAVIEHTKMGRDYASAISAERVMPTTMVSGACFAIGREAFLELGGFDERFFMYFEDADLCRRAAAAGMPIRYVPSAVVTHIGGASSEGDYHFSPMHARSMRQYLGKWYGPGGSVLALALLWLRAAGMSLSLQRGAPLAWRAWWAALRDEDPRR